MLQRVTLVLGLLLGLSLAALAGPSQAVAAPSVEVVSRQNALNYPISIEFSITLRPSVVAGPQTKALLEYQLVNAGGTQNLAAQTNRQADGLLVLKAKVQAQDFIFTGERLRYRWIVTFDDGGRTATEAQELLYFDNRFEWNDAERGLHTIHWYSGDQNYVDNMAKAAEEQRARLKQRFDLNSTERYNLWFYDRQDAMTQVFKDPEVRNFQGMAAPVQRVAVVLFPPIKPEANNFVFYRSTLDHEITHLVLNSHIGRYVPSWFDEGFATFVTEPHLNIRKGIVNKAAGTDKFIPLSKLVDGSNFYDLNLDLAYSEAATLLAFIEAGYGDKSLTEIINQFKSGNSRMIGRILLSKLNLTLDDLEQAWLGWLKDGTLPAPTPVPSPVPFVVDTAAPGLVPATTGPGALVQTAEATPTPTPTAEATVIADVPNTPAPTVVSTDKTLVALKNSSGPRLNSLLPLIAVAVALISVLIIGLSLSLVRRKR